VAFRDQTCLGKFSVVSLKCSRHHWHRGHRVPSINNTTDRVRGIKEMIPRTVSKNQLPYTRDSATFPPLFLALKTVTSSTLHVLLIQRLVKSFFFVAENQCGMFYRSSETKKEYATEVVSKFISNADWVRKSIPAIQFLHSPVFAVDRFLTATGPAISNSHNFF
jgi:hypothetical protein